MRRLHDPQTLTDVLLEYSSDYQVVDSWLADWFPRLFSLEPDIIILKSLLSATRRPRSCGFEKGMENVLFLIYQCKP